MRVLFGRRVAVGLAICGGLLAPVAGYGLVATSGTGRSAAELPRTSLTAAEPPGPPAVSVQRRTYEPGQSSGWHVHGGIHTVIVSSGVLTVYDAGCRARTFGVDEPYIGGTQDHLVRNETDAPVEMTVVYVAQAAAAAEDHLHLRPPPEGCAADLAVPGAPRVG